MNHNMGDSDSQKGMYNIMPGFRIRLKEFMESQHGREWLLIERKGLFVHHSTHAYRRRWSVDKQLAVWMVRKQVSKASVFIDMEGWHIQIHHTKNTLISDLAYLFEMHK